MKWRVADGECQRLLRWMLRWLIVVGIRIQRRAQVAGPFRLGLNGERRGGVQRRVVHVIQRSASILPALSKWKFLCAQAVVSQR